MSADKSRCLKSTFQHTYYITPRFERSVNTVSTVISCTPLAPDEILSQSSGDYLSQIEQHALPSEAHSSSIIIQTSHQ